MICEVVMIMAVKIFNVLENAAWSHHNPVMPDQTQRLQSTVTPTGHRYCEPRLKTSAYDHGRQDFLIICLPPPTMVPIYHNDHIQL